jgi:site-specific DNA-methyltransferase (adenine-specific)
MKIELVKIDDLDLDPRNARKHDAKNLKAIADSLEQFGQRKPIVVWGRTVVAGNGTMVAARSLGWTEITVARVPDDWTADQVKAYALADNRSAELAVWDEQVLASQLLELQQAEFDIELLGFELPVDELQDVVEDEIPEQVEPKAKLGQIWKLGRHKLICGDSTDEQTVAKLLKQTKPDLVLTDPPYNQPSSGGDNDYIGKAINKVTDSISAMIDFEPKDTLELLHKLNKNSVNWIFYCSKDLLWDYLDFAKNNKLAFNVLVWQKPNAIPIGSSYRPDVEYVIHLRKNSIWNNNLPNVNYSKVLFAKRETGKEHPTIKPQEILINQLMILSNPKSAVLDLFGGSGSTLIACEQTDRTCFMMELDPKYVDVIIARWEKLTGEQAQLIEG